MTLCDDVATLNIFLYMDTHPMGGGGVYMVDLPSGKYML